MFTKRKALLMGMLFLLLFTSACGGAAATEAPVSNNDSKNHPPTEEPAAPVAPMPAPVGTTSAPQAEAPMSAPDSSTWNWGAPPAERQPYDTFFEDYGVNPSIDTEDDHLSTFALDVDTGSYTIMRNYLKDGFTVPPESVRVEEYVNYFDQGYPNPSAHQAFNISIDGAPSPFTQTERYHMLRVGIRGYQVPEYERKDASLTFVIDVSGSMDMDNRLGLVKRSLELLVEQLGPRDSVSIVVYGTDARVVLDPTPGSDKGAILSAIYRLQPEGVTNAEAGIRLGYKMALRAYNPEGINRVILCSDGVANFGNTEAEIILDEIRGYVEEGVTMTTIGFGMDNYNDVLMEQLADNGDGFYAYVDDMREAQRLFIDNLTSTLQTIAMDAKIQVDFNPEVVARYRLVGFENRAIADDDFRDNTVDAGEVGAGHSVTALYEVKLYPEAYGNIATVYLRWEDPDTRQVVEMSRDFRVDDLERNFERADPYFQRAVIVAEYAEILKESYWADGSSMEDVYREAVRVREYFGRDEDMSELLELMRRAGHWVD
ncbi:MAG TPA: von Willebrand factor type A domain-containing protein [Anaerolineales bacterium]|nr:von Willebrand factor type A domain-containing protein [Anaerolineales bacterium]